MVAALTARRLGRPDGLHHRCHHGLPAMRPITNYVALAATHYPCMPYGTIANLTSSAIAPASTAANHRRLPNGMIVPGTGLNMKACSDGTSKTLMICETLEPAVNCWYDGTTAWTTAINPSTVTSATAHQDRHAAINPRGFWVVTRRQSDRH